MCLKVLIWQTLKQCNTTDLSLNNNLIILETLITYVSWKWVEGLTVWWLVLAEWLWRAAESLQIWLFERWGALGETEGFTAYRTRGRQRERGSLVSHRPPRSGFSSVGRRVNTGVRRHTVAAERHTACRRKDQTRAIPSWIQEKSS